MRAFFAQWAYTYPLRVVGAVGSAFVLLALWLLSPIVIIKVGGLTAQRIGHLALNTDLFLRKRQLYGTPKKTIHLFLAGSVANRQLLTMFRRHLTIVENRLLRGLFEQSKWLWKRTQFLEPLEMHSNEYPEFNLAKATLHFTPAEEEKGKAELRKMGIHPEKDWFICIFARDPVYIDTVFANGKGHRIFGQKDWSHHDFRNVDIDTFRLAIEYIVGLGGYLLRMGHHVQKPLGYKHEKVIDYAVKYRTDFMDIYLAAKCRFFLGTSSGICDLPMIFDVPRICVNEAPPKADATGKNCLAIPKKIKRRHTKEYVSFGEIIRLTKKMYDPVILDGRRFYEKGYEYEDNTAEDILDVTKEMIERLEGKFVQSDEDKAMLRKYHALFPDEHWSAQVKTPVGREFLRKNRQLFE